MNDSMNQPGLAQTNYPIRFGSFAYSFVVIIALFLERNVPLDVGTLALPVLALLVYPHIAYAHARSSPDPNRTELNYLLVDAVLLGVLAAQTGLALWLSFAFVMGIAVNNAVCAGARRLAVAVLLLAGSALASHVLRGPAFQTATGTLVTALCVVGIAGYVASVGLIVHRQNTYLVRTRDILRRGEEQFRFIAEHATDFVTVLDSKGRIRYTSGTYLERFDPNLISVGSHWSGIIEPSQRARAREFLISTLRSGASSRENVTFVTANGSLLELETAVNVMEDTDGEGRRLLVISRARSALEQNMQDRFVKQLAGQRPGYGLIVTSVLGRIEMSDSRMNEIIGYPSGGLIGRTINEIAEAIPASDSLMDDVWNAVEASGSSQFKFVLIEASGQLKLAWANVVPLSGSDKSTPRYAWTILEDQAHAEPFKQPASL